MNSNGRSATTATVLVGMAAAAIATLVCGCAEFWAKRTDIIPFEPKFDTIGPRDSFGAPTPPGQVAPGP